MGHQEKSHQYHQENAFSNSHSHQPSIKRRSKWLACSNCHAFRGRISSSSSSPSSPRKENPDRDFSDQDVSAIVNRYMKSKAEQNSAIALNGFDWASASTIEDMSITSKAMQGKRTSTDADEGEEFFTANSRLSRCSSATEAFGSAKMSIPRSSSSSRLLEFRELWRRHLIVQELRHCKGWPFGLCQKVLLLPPLPNSPSDSWSWHKSGIKLRR